MSKIEPKVELLDIALIDEDLFVRVALDEKWAETLGDLLMAGTELPPVIVCSVGDRFRLLDGRHRKWAYEANGKTTIPAIIVEVAGGEVELIAASYRYNVGGSMPPTISDTQHTIEAMLDAGASKKKIGDLLDLPALVARKYIETVEQAVKRRRVNKAAHDVAERSLTLPEAAEINNVTVDELKARMGVKPGRKKKEKNDFVGAGLNACSRKHRGLSSSRGKYLAELVKRVIESEVTPQQALDVLDALGKMARQDIRTVEDWRKRLALRVNGTVK